MLRGTRTAAAALTVGIALATAACGSSGGTEASAPRTTATTAPETTPAGPVEPEVAEATVAPAPTDPDAVAQFGQDGVEAGYRELVELATTDAWNADYFLHDGDNRGSDLDPVLAGRMHQNQADFVRSQADICADESIDDGGQACGDVYAVAYFSFYAGDDHTLAFRPDGAFVTDQSIENPTVTTNVIEGQSGLHITFDHVAHARLLLDGEPIVVTMTRKLSYDLWEAPPGNATRYWIVNWSLQYQGDVLDERTGEPVEDPAA